MKQSSPQNKIGIGYVKMHGSMATAYMILEMGVGGGGGGRPTNSIISKILLILEH